VLRFDRRQLNAGPSTQSAAADFAQDDKAQEPVGLWPFDFALPTLAAKSRHGDRRKDGAPQLVGM
jgi:hypothetical protein